jgi:hypothetical protein
MCTVSCSGSGNLPSSLLALIFFRWSKFWPLKDKKLTFAVSEVILRAASSNYESVQEIEKENNTISG